MTVAELERACVIIRDLAEGREVDLDGTPVQLKWSEGRRLPVWVAAYGPQALRCAGRVADGVILQLADPFIIEWALRYLREGAEQAGRNPADIKVMAAAPPTSPPTSRTRATRCAGSPPWSPTTWSTWSTATTTPSSRPS